MSCTTYLIAKPQKPPPVLPPISPPALRSSMAHNGTCCIPPLIPSSLPPAAPSLPLPPSQADQCASPLPSRLSRRQPRHSAWAVLRGPAPHLRRPGGGGRYSRRFTLQCKCRLRGKEEWRSSPTPPAAMLRSEAKVPICPHRPLPAAVARYAEIGAAKGGHLADVPHFVRKAALHVTFCAVPPWKGAGGQRWNVV